MAKTVFELNPNYPCLSVSEDGVRLVAKAANFEYVKAARCPEAHLVGYLHYRDHTVLVYIHPILTGKSAVLWGSDELEDEWLTLS